MEYIRTGNVLKSKYNSIIIITEVLDGERFMKKNRGKFYEWVSFDYANSGGGTYYKTIEKEEHHFDDCGYICGDPECEICHGTGLYTETDWGLEDAEFLGSCVKEYIIKSLTKNFQF